MSPPLITTDSALREVIAALAASPWVALDTEFMRERTYRARLCLLQLATDEALWCIDPLAVDVTPLLAALQRASLSKVLHAARQDLEVLYDSGGAVLAPVFDTQIAAALLGHEDQIGYGNLVERLTQHRLPKLHTRTDWEARPLAPEPLEYAFDDVRYLRVIYHRLREELDQRQRLPWLGEECARLTEPALYRIDPEEAWRRVRAGQSLPAAAQGRLRALAVWRERVAQEKNLPRGWVLKDPVLIALALRAPDSLEALAQIEGLAPGAVRKWGEAILALLNESRRLPPTPVWHTPPRLDPAQQNFMKEASGIVTRIAAAEQVNATTLATRDDLLTLTLHASGRLTDGWRRRLVGEELLALRARLLDT
jgi:ribonuclease D